MQRMELSLMPYPKRQFITVIDDAVVEAMRTVASQSASDENWKGQSLDWATIVDLVLKLLSNDSLIMAAVTLAKIQAAYMVWVEARNRGLPILQVSTTEASQLKFPPGNPRLNVLYVGHPTDATVYYPVADFHRVTFEHKVSEAIWLLTCLGATHMSVECIRGWGTELAAKLSVPLGAAASLSTGGGAGSAETEQFLYEANLRGTDNPHVPDGLVWYPHESTWQTIAKSRLTAGLKQFSLSVVYEDDFGVHARLKAEVAGSGLELGGDVRGSSGNHLEDQRLLRRLGRESGRLTSPACNGGPSRLPGSLWQYAARPRTILHGSMIF